MASKDGAEQTKPADQEPKKSDWDLAMEVAESENPFHTPAPPGASQSPINPYDGHIDNEEKEKAQASRPSRAASQRSLTARTAPLPYPNFSFPKRADSRHRAYSEQHIGQASSSRLMPILASSREALGSPSAPTLQRVTFNEEPRIPSPDAILDISMDSLEEIRRSDMARDNNPFDSDSEKSLPTSIHIRSKERDEEDALASRPRRHRPPTPMPILFGGGASPASSPTIELDRSPDRGRVSSGVHPVRPDTPIPGSSPAVRDFVYEEPYLAQTVDLTPPPRSLQRPYNPRGGIEVSLSRGQSLNFASSSRRTRGRGPGDDSQLTMAEALRQFSSPPPSAQALSVRRGPEIHRFGTMESVSAPTVSIAREDTGPGILGEHPLARVGPRVVARRRERRILWTLGVGTQLGVISFSCSLAVIITEAAIAGRFYAGVAVWASVSFVWCLVTIIWLVIRIDKCGGARRRRRRRGRTTAAALQGDDDLDLEQGRDGEEWHELQEVVGHNRLVNKQLPVANAQNVATATMADEQQRRQDEHWTRFAQDEGQLRRHVENLEDKLRAAEEELTQYRGAVQVVPESRTVSLAQASTVGGTPSSYQSKRNKGKGKERDLRTAVSQRALLRNTTFENNDNNTMMPASGTDGSIITALCAGVGAGAASEPYSPLDNRSSRATPGRSTGDGGDFSSLAGTSITMREARVRAAEQNEPIHLSVMPNGHIRMSSYDIMGGRIPEFN
ncbi:uncharacterized protein E0L32_002460 [Thyridium curvatum]|uniref:Uncharacterized protein n=1 Tax=Thyridium curvatum TaxID=1093900 RepID=A0A507BGI3_9PEZI|nr:uncharacterized protein E0L32_002460 [Thyridium curvatum]TPX18603.1 hypothetical protein E0L32_002460 [Thyridium curvatum]